jgi:hypothetical protein
MNAELELVDPDAKPIDAEELRTRLRRKFPADQYAMMYEVRDGAGHSANRSADVMMIGLWPSRGCLIEGMELKISRGDWLRELKRPEKAEAFVPYCDRWWVIASDAAIVKLEEVPATWGLMICAGRGVKVVKDAPKLEAKPVDRSLLAAMMKRATDTAADSPEVKARIEARIKAHDEEFAQRVKWATHHLESESKRLKDAIAKFEVASGVAISDYNGERIGEAVRMVMKGEHEWKLKELDGMRDQARRLHEWFEKEFAQPSTGSS